MKKCFSIQTKPHHLKQSKRRISRYMYHIATLHPFFLSLYPFLIVFEAPCIFRRASLTLCSRGGNLWVVVMSRVGSTCWPGSWWVVTLVQPIWSQISSLTQLLTWLKFISFRLSPPSSSPSSSSGCALSTVSDKLTGIYSISSEGDSNLSKTSTPPDWIKTLSYLCIHGDQKEDRYYSGKNEKISP